MIRSLIWFLVLGVPVFSVNVLAERSILETINEPYKKPDLKVEVWAERLESEGREVFDYRNEIVSAIGLKKGQHVADVGAGTGLFEPLLAYEVGAEGRVYAVDIVPKFIEHIKNKARERGLKQITTVLSTERSIELPPNSVDVVFISDAYHHFVYYEDMLASIHSALRPGGQLVLVEFDKVPGQSTPFLFEHTRATKVEFIAEIETNGFRLTEDIHIEGLIQNFMSRFEKK